MRNNKALVSFIVIVIVFFGIIEGYIFYNNFIQKEDVNQEKQSENDNLEKNITLELINELLDYVPHNYYNVYKSSKDMLSNITKANIYGEVVTRLNFKPTTEKYFYNYGNYYLEDCEVASIDEFRNNIQKMYNLDFDSKEIKDNFLGYYEENYYYYLNNTLIKIKHDGINSVKNYILNNFVDYELKDDNLIITEKIAFYNTLSYYDSYNFNEKNNKYVLSNMYNQKYYFSTKKELEQYFKENLSDFTTYKSTFKKINNSFYWNNTEKLETDYNHSDTQWISCADYAPKSLIQNYNTGGNHYLSNIKVPLINIISNDARKINEEIKKLYEENLDIYKEAVANSLPWFVTVDYEYFTYDKIGSVIITSSSGGTDVIHPRYSTYNFDTNNGKLLTYQEVYSLLGYTSNEIEQKVKNEITTIMREELKDFKDPLKDTGDGGYYPDGTSFENYNNESINSYKNSVSNNSIKYFINNDKKLNIIVTLSIPAGSGSFDTIIKIT